MRSLLMSLKVKVQWSTVGRQGSRSPSQRRAAFPGGAAAAACEPLLCCSKHAQSQKASRLFYSKHAQLRNPCHKRHQNYFKIGALLLALLGFYWTQVRSLSALVTNWLNALCCYPNVNSAIGNLSLTTPTATIFLLFNYFRGKYLG